MVIYSFVELSDPTNIKPLHINIDISDLYKSSNYLLSWHSLHGKNVQ
jgi:hypothetical protein